MAGSHVTVGSAAPDLVLRDHAVASTDGLPRVLAFVRGWSVDREQPEGLRALRAQLRGLGAELIVLADAGVWSFHPDDAIDQAGTYSDRLAGDIATTALLYGVRDGRDAVFVIDGDGVIRFAHRLTAPMHTTLAVALDAATEAVLTRGAPVTFTRREWLTTCLVAGFAFTLLGCKDHDAPKPRAAVAAPTNDVRIALDVNGRRHELEVEPRVSLLDALRERLGLTGTKKGCDMGQCGACTVLVDGRRVLACLTLAVMAQGKRITTIEGLAQGSTLHPVQEAFIAHDALQCGFCTPGQILSAVALLEENRATSDDEIREQMSGNLCRCGAYPNIVAAIKAARKGNRG